MAQEIFYGEASPALPPLTEFAKTEPVTIRVLNPEVEADVAIAAAWDAETIGEGGALHPFEPSSPAVMTDEELRTWMRGDERHMLRGIFEKEKDVGFVYTYDDLDGRKRLRFLQSRGLVPKNASHREINWWTDRATPKQAESGIAQTLLELFTRKETKRPLAIVLYVEKDDIAVDGELARRLGFKEIAKGISYDQPGNPGGDTAFLLTQESFVQALGKR